VDSRGAVTPFESLFFFKYLQENVIYIFNISEVFNHNFNIPKIFFNLRNVYRYKTDSIILFFFLYSNMNIKFIFFNLYSNTNIKF